MSSSKIVNTYANAFVKVVSSLEGAEQDGLVDHLEVLAETIRNKEFDTFFSSPIISNQEKIEVLLSSSNSFSTQVRGLITTLANAKRISILPEVAVVSRKLLRKVGDQQEATIEVANGISEDQKKQIVSELEKMLGGTFSLVEVENPKLIGGYIVRIENKIIDLSLETRVRQLAKCAII